MGDMELSRICKDTYSINVSYSSRKGIQRKTSACMIEESDVNI
jgi:hypothetical protein